MYRKNFKDIHQISSRLLFLKEFNYTDPMRSNKPNNGKMHGPKETENDQMAGNNLEVCLF
jgi:hypothetical protein